MTMLQFSVIAKVMQALRKSFIQRLLKGVSENDPITSASQMCDARVCGGDDLHGRESPVCARAHVCDASCHVRSQIHVRVRV
jgi:hypothetical protein